MGTRLLDEEPPQVRLDCTAFETCRGGESRLLRTSTLPTADKVAAMSTFWKRTEASEGCGASSAAPLTAPATSCCCLSTAVDRMRPLRLNVSPYRTVDYGVQ